MSNKLLFALAMSAGLTLSGVIPSSAVAKASHKTTRSSHSGYSHAGNYLVPPPPAYMPSILPELKMASKTAEPKKPKTTVKKHIYFAQGYEEPEPVKPNKNVTYWNQKDSSQTGVVSYE